MSDIQGGIAFLRKHHPHKRSFLMGDVMERAGHDRSGIKLYAMIKYLRKHNKEKELSELRELFLSVGVTILPIEKWSKEKAMATDKPDDELILMRQTDCEVIEPKRFEIVEKEIEMEATAFDSKPYLNRNAFDNDIDALSVILKILAPMSRDKRESILSSAESFFAMGT
jgi:hypothetical protein